MAADTDIKAKLEPGEAERPTLKTIARLSGLAVPTVSRALSDAPDIGKDTKERVRDLARQLGYRRNRAGLRLRTGKTNVIALVLNTEHDVMSHGFRLITAVATELRHSPYHAIILPYFPDEDPMVPIRYIVESGSADGIIINRILPDDPRVAYLTERDFPFSMHGRTRHCDRYPYYDFDNAAFGTRVVDLAHEQGRKSLLIVAPPLEQNYARLMVDAATAQGAALGMQVRLLDSTTSDEASDAVASAVRRHLAAHPETDAIMCSSVPSAVGATLGAEETGRGLGQDITVIAKESAPFLKGFRREILIVREDVTEAGQFLARAVLQAIDQPDLPPMQKLVQPL